MALFRPTIDYALCPMNYCTLAARLNINHLWCGRGLNNGDEFRHRMNDISRPTGGISVLS